MGHIIAIYGMQGGVGCTTIAVNIAARLAERQAKVLLMDMNLPYGDVSTSLNLYPKATLLDCLTSDLDDETLETIVMMHESGLKVLAAPPKIADAQIVYDRADRLAHALDVIQDHYDLIVVDAGHYPSPAIVDILNRAISVVLVMQPSLLSAKNARLTLDWFEQLNFPPDKCVPIINRVSDERAKQKKDVLVLQIEKHLKCSFEAQLPLDEQTAEGALNKGVTISARQNASSRLAQALNDLGRYVYRMLVYDDNEFATTTKPPEMTAKPSLTTSKPPQTTAKPLPTTAIPPARPSPSVPAFPVSHKDGSTISILLVDDVVEVRESLKKLLAFETDMKVVGTATNGREAFEMAKELRPDIVIMDIDMPEMDGIQAAGLINKGVPTTAVILMAVESSSDVLQRAMLAGARNFLSKPIMIDDLYNAVRSSHKSHKQIAAQYQSMSDLPPRLSMDAYAHDFRGGGSGVWLRPAPDKAAARNQSSEDVEESQPSKRSMFGSILFEGSGGLPPRPPKPITAPSTPPPALQPVIENPPNLETMDPEEAMSWMESLAKRQGTVAEELTTTAGLEIDFPSTAADVPDWLKPNVDTIPSDVPDWLQETVSPSDAIPPSIMPDAAAFAPTEPYTPSIPKPVLSQVQFSAYFPRQAAAEVQHGLYVYAHLYEVVSNIRRDVEKYRAELGGSIPEPRLAKSSVELAEGTRITIVPESDTLQFEPESLTKRWKPSWTRFEFDFTPSADFIDETAFVRVSIQIEGIEIAHIKCAVDIEKEAPPTISTAPVARAFGANPLAAAKLASQRAESYRRIFISYSRQDNEIARAYKMAQTALGNDVFLDVDNLRSGENWQAALARAIDSADIFQLFWSEKYAQSEYCRYEWDYALKFRCPDNLCEGFIRPVYWSQPMPPPPMELGHLNFKYVPFGVES